MKKSLLFGVLGLLLGAGAPMGALLCRLLHSPDPPALFLKREWVDFSFFYAYMLLGTCTAFAIFGFFAGRSEDLLIKKDKALSKEVLTDPLTGLGNHRFLHDVFRIEFRKHQESRQPISCLMMDLDFFKKVNDEHGHPFGDIVLKLFAQIIEDSVRQGDIATRYGGEEFLCILPNCGEKDAKTVAERIRLGVEKESFRDGPYEVNITVSLGAVTLLNPIDTNYYNMIEAADKNLYEAKSRGRNQVVQTVL